MSHGVSVTGATGRPARILPPVYFLVALVVMAGLHFRLPVGHVIQPPYGYGGGVLIVGGLVLVVWAARLFQRAGTAIRPFERSSALVTDGPYRYSRNPMYLGMVCVLTGLGLVLGTIASFAVIPVFVWLIQQRFIRPEEAVLARTFGSAYAEYRERVRRWL
jgi:protein-S-isoprenylcysteine O-methyltransferase Ste14